MKIRRDFITNSSSSSFIIQKKYLTKNQLRAIRNYDKMAKKLNLDYCTEDWWNIEENDSAIAGYTYMDNFDIGELFDIIGVTKVEWDEYPFDIDAFEDLNDGQSSETSAMNWEDMLDDDMV